MVSTEGAHVYIGMAGERSGEAYGLYRMDAEGGEWVALTNGLPAEPEVRALAQHPQDADTVFAGTQHGVYRSGDRGDHWERLDLPETGNAVWSLLFHPTDSATLFAGYESAEIYRSEDGGASWRPLRVEVRFPSITTATPKRVIGMSSDPGSPEEMYAAIEVGGLIRSLNGGESWQGVSEGFYVNDDSLDVHGVLASRAQPHSVYAITRIGMFRSQDRGDHWEYVDLENLSDRGTYCRSIREAPDDPSTLYLAAGAAFRSETGALYRSRNAGVSWEKLDLGHSPGSSLFGVAINPGEPRQLYCCSSGGEVFGSQDGGGSWEAYPLPESARDVRAIVCG